MKIISAEKKICLDDFMRMFNFKQDILPKETLSLLPNINTYYREPSMEEYEEHILNMLKMIHSPHLNRTKQENLDAFERGWKGNLDLIKKNGITQKNLKPGYFRPSRFLRYNNSLIVTENLNLEYDLFTIARYIIFNKYIRDYDIIYEIGSGSCQNLFFLSDLYPEKELHSLDWANSSLEIADYIAKSLGRNIKGHIFDMLDPSDDMVIEKGSAIITIHSMEQIGKSHDKLLSFIIRSQPRIIVHYEPILEFYNENNLLDYLALLYSKKRNYLSGYLTALRDLENKGKIKIIEATRPYLGGIIHEASLVVWKPV